MWVTLSHWAKYSVRWNVPLVEVPLGENALQVERLFRWKCPSGFLLQSIAAGFILKNLHFLIFFSHSLLLRRYLKLQVSISEVVNMGLLLSDEESLNF
ncbi:hypothetical protein RIF29_27818 [Crotalaria pallida]|uniref:Uncharacterized protein n=1 Tax=Crotalaria pallida TaxID=3830 RepID=A0AAN9I1D4_CROPI